MVVMVNRQPHGAQCVYGAHFTLVAWHIGIGERQHHVVEHGHARQQVKALEHEPDAQGADLGKLIVGKLRHVEAFEQIATGGGRIQAAQDVHEGRFAGARGAGDRHELTGHHGERDVVQDVRQPCIAFEDAVDMAYINDGADGH